MNAIVIDYQPFAANSMAFVFKEGQSTEMPITSNIEEMAIFAVSLCYNQNIFNISIDAPVDILDNFETKVLEEEQRRFSHNQIEVRSLQIQ